MRPEAARYIERARQDLDEARQIAAITLAKVAARSAYYATFHAAEAYIVERTGRSAKTHAGVRKAFARLSKDDPNIVRSMTSFLAKAYGYKEISDYAVDSYTVITMEEAADAIASAAQFIDGIQVALA